MKRIELKPQELEEVKLLSEYLYDCLVNSTDQRHCYEEFQEIEPELRRNISPASVKNIGLYLEESQMAYEQRRKQKSKESLQNKLGWNDEVFEQYWIIKEKVYSDSNLYYWERDEELLKKFSVVLTPSQFLDFTNFQQTNEEEVKKVGVRMNLTAYESINLTEEQAIDLYDIRQEQMKKLVKEGSDLLSEEQIFKSILNEEQYKNWEIFMGVKQPPN